MFRDYYDEADSGALRNPYEPRPEPAGPPARQHVAVLGLIGAGLTAVFPAAARDVAHLAAVPDRIAATTSATESALDDLGEDH